MEYFSEKEKGVQPRTKEIMPPAAWGGIVSLVQSMSGSGAFGKSFPDMCPDGNGPVGTDERAFSLSLRAEVPEIEWPLITSKREGEGYFAKDRPWAPDTLVALDFIQFCFLHAARPIQGSYHGFFQHHHLSFDVEAGREEFQERVNRIFSRNGLAYDLEKDGNIIRLTNAVLGGMLQSRVFASGDGVLDGMLEDARRKFLNPDPKIRKEAVERLWDGWERLKSIHDPSDKKRSITALLVQAAPEPGFRKMLDEEAKKLTEIGNTFQIRHSEVSQTLLQDTRHLDYLFHRLFSMIALLLDTKD